MSESYAESVVPVLLERERQWATAARLTGRLIRSYAYINHVGLVMPEAIWKPDEKPKETAWLTPLNADGKIISKNELNLDDFTAAVHAANFVLSDDEGNWDPLFTIHLARPIVLGYDDQLILPDQMNGVMGDLQTYQAALDAGRYNA